MADLSLIPTIEAGRPAILKLHGTTFYVAIHDVWFLENVKRLYTKMINKHPDKPIIKSGGFKEGGGRKYFEAKRPGNGHSRYLKATQTLGNFLARERDGFYKSIGILPPKWDRWERWATEGKVTVPPPSKGRSEEIAKAMLNVWTT